MRSAARLALLFPQEERFYDFALHGLRYLRDVMWDHQHGGLYTLVAADGSPLAGGTKHAHGTAYAVQGCAVVYQATGDSNARALSEEAFEWFDARAHDDEHGGYHSWLTRAGRVIRSAEEVPTGAAPVDPVADAIGMRDINVHGDWLEGLNESVSILNHRGMAERLQEIAGIFLNHITTPHGDVFYGFHKNWSPLPQPERFGHAFQTIERLYSAAAKLPDGDRMRRRAVAIGDQAFRHAARSDGGYLCFRAIHAPDHLEGVSLIGRRRVWWIQLAALNALPIMADGCDDGGERYRAILRRHWRFIQEQVIDRVYGGFHPVVPQDLGRSLRLPRSLDNRPELAKGSVWKDMSHEVDSLLGTLRLLKAAPAVDGSEGVLAPIQC
jgi:mannobiose 2-epimerase